jgi:hypothetical protein
MKAVEFETTMNPHGQIALPPEFAHDIPTGQQHRVVVMWEAFSDDSAWREAGQRRFEDAYCEEDAVYENLMNDPPSR